MRSGGTGTSVGAPRREPESAVQSAAPRSRTAPSNNPVPRSATRENSAAARTSTSSASANASAFLGSMLGRFVRSTASLRLRVPCGDIVVVVVAFVGAFVMVIVSESASGAEEAC